MRLHLTIAFYVTVAAAILGLIGCSRRSTPQEDARLNELARQFPEYIFKVSDGTYLDATNTKADNVAKDEAMRIYRFFWLEGNGERRPGIDLTYLNIFNKKGEFLYQLNWEDGKFYFGNSPYH